MLTKDVRIWLEKVERRQYSYNDAMEIFLSFLPYLTKDEMYQLKRQLEASYKS